MSSKNNTVNPVLIAHDFNSLLDRGETPEHIEKTEGYIWVTGIEGNKLNTTVKLQIRDHDRVKFESKKEYFTTCTERRTCFSRFLPRCAIMPASEDFVLAMCNCHIRKGSDSVRNRLVFKGLKPEEFTHPSEDGIKKALNSSKDCQKILSALSGTVTAYTFTQRVGVYVMLSPATAPKLFHILKDVCRILDVENVPDLYITHFYGQLLLPCGNSELYLLIGDYTAEHYDEDMLYYLFGNAIAMIKADHVTVTNIAAYMSVNLYTLLPNLLIKQYLHVADATSDRGGLLACQSLSAAARCHFTELGMPMEMASRLFQHDGETAHYIEQYLSEVRLADESDSALTRLAEKWQNLNYYEAPANRMLRELYDWYRSGYQTILREYALRAEDGHAG